MALITVGVVGSPSQVARSLSPAIHNAAFQSLGIDGLYVGLPVRDGKLKESVRVLIESGMRGFNVTMPHKVAIIELLDRLEGEAEEIGAVNTVEVRGDQLIGSSTDGEGFVRYLEKDVGFGVPGAIAVVVGAGGAARSVVFSLARRGVAAVHVLAREAGRARALEPLAAGSEFSAEQIDGSKAAFLLGSADLVVNATPVGQLGESLPLASSTMRSGVVVVDLVYRPPVTPLMKMAQQAGASVHGGLGMLLHQAALSFRTWTGFEPPLEVMSAAALRELHAQASI